MDLTLTPAQLELQARARAFVRDVLQPREVEFEGAGGKVSRAWGAPIRRVASLDCPVAYAPDLEEEILPQSADVLNAIRDVCRY